MIKRFYGFNVAVKDLEAAAKRYSDALGLPAVPVPPEGFAFKNPKGYELTIGGVKISLIAADDPNTSVAQFVGKKGEGVFLVSFEVTDIDNDIKALAAKGLQPVVDKSLPYAGGRAAWMHPKSMHGVQVELIQPDK